MRWAQTLARSWSNSRGANSYWRIHSERREFIEKFLHQTKEANGGADRGDGQNAAQFSPLLLPYLDFCVVPLRRMYSWAIPSEEALVAIEKASPLGIVEIGAGAGYWAYLLQQRGIVVDCFDKKPLQSATPNGHHAFPISLRQCLPKRLRNEIVMCESADLMEPSFHLPSFVNVYEGGPEVLRNFPNQTLLLCWPPPEIETNETLHGSVTEENFMAFDSLSNFLGNTVVYIGQEPSQGEGLTTAGPRFGALLQSEWTLAETIPLPNWPLCSDTLSVWNRTKMRTRGSEPSKVNHTQGNPAVVSSGEVAELLRWHLLRHYTSLWENWVVNRVVHRALMKGNGMQGSLSEAERNVLQDWKKDANLLRRSWVQFVLWWKNVA